MSLPDVSRLSLQPAATGVNLAGHAQCDPSKSAWPCMRLKPSLHNWRLAAPLLDPGITMDSCTMMVKATEGASWARDTPYYTVKNSWQWQVFLDLVREKMPRYKVRFRLAVTSEAWLQAGRKPEVIPDKDPNATWYNLAKDKGFFDGDLHGSSHKGGKYIMGFVSFKEVHAVVLATLFTAMHEYNQRFPAPLLASPVEPKEEEQPPAPAPAPAVAPQESARKAKQARREEASARMAQKKQEFQDELEQLKADDVWSLLGPEPKQEPETVPDPVPEPARVPEPELPELPSAEEVREFEKEYFGS